MDKRARQYIGIAAALVAYYVIHEGAHLIAALCMGVFRELRFLGLGMQVDVAAAQMSDTQLGVFCLVGALATLIAAVVLTLLAPRICNIESKPVKAAFYYVTLTMLMLDPLYLSLLCGFFGGGDMNGIALLIPELWARLGFGVLLAAGALVFAKRILPLYKAAFEL